ncbi:MSCRAMM family protein [Schaalia suimastitidis]|uniref:MSCRAMM family protein n=1 Tax=Schaalia suimastitidis TaxID=121163 RepID=UPI000428035E|nr:SpaA isopeptide-forming pilin-related protein [Schaalia suimastitidis]
MPQHSRASGIRSRTYAFLVGFVVFVLALVHFGPIRTSAAPSLREETAEAISDDVDASQETDNEDNETEGLSEANTVRMESDDVASTLSSESISSANDPSGTSAETTSSGYTAFRSVSTARAFTQNGALNCGNGVIYALEADGGVYLMNINPTTGVATGTSSYAFQFNRSWSASYFNALAIGQNGTVAYSVARRDNGVIGIYYWTSSGENRRVFHGPIGANFSNDALVAGAMNPVNGGDYYFGGFYESWGSIYFELWRYNVNMTSPEKVGDVYIRESSGEQGLNGDLAINANGDAFILWNTAGGYAQGIVPVSKEALANATGGNIQPGVSEPDTSVSARDQYNGIALDSTGRLLLQNMTNSVSTIKTLNGFTFETIGSAQIAGVRDAGDLASCASPTTVEVKKNIVSRVTPTDQFRYGISLGTRVLAAATSGSNLGVQAQVAGPQIVMTGTTYSIWETAQDGTDITGYKTSLSCSEKETGQSLTTVQSTTDPRQYDLTIPARTPGVAITCEFRNEAAKGSLRWTKTDADTGALLARSQWRLTSTADPNIFYTITDNVWNDADPTAGSFFVNQVIPQGTYTLTETTVPQGYVKAPDRTVNVMASSYLSPLDLGPIPNRKIQSSVTWTKTDTAGAALAGSEWTLTPTNPAGPAMTIRDCIASPCTAANYDADPRPGYFRVDRVKYGTYTLAESAAPAGYVPDPTPRTITVTTDGATIVVGAITNAKAEGSITWSKTDGQTPANALGGSAWTITPTNPAGPAITVEDCASAPCASSMHDVDPTKGSLRVDKLPFGAYTLTESRAPVGYKLVTTQYPFTINTVGQVVNLGAKINRPQDPVRIPLTGGMGADHLLIAGTGITLLALLVGPLWRRRKQH